MSSCYGEVLPNSVMNRVSLPFGRQGGEAEDGRKRAQLLDPVSRWEVALFLNVLQVPVSPEGKCPRGVTFLAAVFARDKGSTVKEWVRVRPSAVLIGPRVSVRGLPWVDFCHRQRMELRVPVPPDSPDLRSVLFPSPLIFSLFHTKPSCPAPPSSNSTHPFPFLQHPKLHLPSISRNGFPCPRFPHGYHGPGRSPCHACPGRQRLQAYHHR